MRYNLACGQHLAGRVAWIGLASSGGAAAACRRARGSLPNCIPPIPFTCACAPLPSQASLLLFWWRYPKLPGGPLAKIFMGTQAAVFILELLWRQTGLRDPCSSRYARWREALVAVLRVNEGLLGTRCLASGRARGRRQGRRQGRRPWAAARWRQARGSARLTGAPSSDASMRTRRARNLPPLPLHPHPTWLACSGRKRGLKVPDLVARAQAWPTCCVTPCSCSMAAVLLFGH